jgi:hypothetical protein
LVSRCHPPLDLHVPPMLMSGGTPFISIETQKQFVQADRLLLCFGSGTSELCYLNCALRLCRIAERNFPKPNKFKIAETNIFNRANAVGG